MSIRIKIHPNNKSTLSGIDSKDLKQLITIASLYCYNRYDEIDSKDIEYRQYYEHMLDVLKILKEAMNTGIDNTFPKISLLPLTKKQRLEEVEKQRKLNRYFKLIFNNLTNNK